MTSYNRHEGRERSAASEYYRHLMTFNAQKLLLLLLLGVTSFTAHGPINVPPEKLSSYRQLHSGQLKHADDEINVIYGCRVSRIGVRCLGRHTCIIYWITFTL